MPRARAFARQVATGCSDDMVGDLELVVSELVTNAILHGAPPVLVRLSASRDLVRVEVHDAGHNTPIVQGQTGHDMTGRGLTMVAAVASRWGVDASPGGRKLVWAELQPQAGAPGGPGAPPGSRRPGGGAGRPAGTGPDIDALLAAWPTEDLDAASYEVELGPVSTELLLAAKAHMDNVVRELALLERAEATSHVPLPAEMAQLVRTVSVEFADVRAQLKRLAAAANARGDKLTDMVLRVDAGAARAGELYLAALEQADRWARSARLLTLAPPRAHRVFREWYVRSLVGQVRALASGLPRPGMRPLDAHLADELEDLTLRAEDSDRLSVLQKVTAGLAEARSVEEMGEIVADNAIGLPGVESARVRLVTDEATLRIVASRARGEARAEAYPEYPIDADLPAALAVRERRRVFVASLVDAFDSDPRFKGFYQPGRSAHIVPLVADDTALGMLSLTFVSGELTSESEISLVQSLADALGQAISRAKLAAAEADKRETLRLLADATQVMVTAREPAEVLDRIVKLAVPRLADWCTVYLADGDVLRRVSMAVQGHPEVAERYRAVPLDLALDTPQARAYRTGAPQTVCEVGWLLEGLYPGLDFPQLGGDRDRETGLCVPIELRGERIGVVAAAFLGSGRRVNAQVVEALSGLATRAAIAFDSARHWSAQRKLVQALVAALLPEMPAPVAGFEFAARYVPAGGDVAGDWWEVHAVPDGRVLIGVGDAAGHGIPAVSVMSELRHGARALASVETSPSALLAALGANLSGVEAHFATALYGLLEPPTGRLYWASAGHMPPMHLRADGAVAVLGDEPGPPLGAPGARPADRQLLLEVGETLLLYSDGVVERRDGSLDEGIDALAGTLSGRAQEELQLLADRIMLAHGSNPVDDCCLLLVRRCAS